MWTLIKNNYKTILQTLGLFVLGVIVAFLTEDYYRLFVRILFKLFNGAKIVFIGKNFHLFASIKFVIAFGLFCSLLFLILNRNIFYYRLKAILYSVITFLLATFLISLLDSKRLIIECTACNDGVRKLNYNEITYDLYFIISLLVSLFVISWLNFKHHKNFDNLIGLWTREDDGSGLLAIFGWSLKFNPDKTGEYKYWQSDNKENVDFDFIWERINKNSIKICTKSSDTWTILDYEIIEEPGAYHSKQYKLTEKNKNEFWYSPEPIFKRK